jgi:ubiquinone/menaquinone biosynthesis C-methylase UbiE
VSAADHFRAVYADGAEDYHRLVEYEDAAGRLWDLLDTLVDWAVCDVIELGAGTGRLTVPLARRARSVRAFDAAAPMLAVAQRRLDADRLSAADTEIAGPGSVTLAVAEHRSLPVDDASADVLIEGWAVAHYVDWEPDTWREALDAAVREMSRVVRVGGRLVLIETLGTGATEPHPPTDALAALYDRLEAVHGFTRQWVRTDYDFADETTARHVVGTFFGEEMLEALDGTSLPECTGVWTAVAPVSSAG